MTIAIYIRVSTEEQAQHGHSVDFQKERLIAYCKSQGWDDFKLYIDDGYTGTNMDRPALKRLRRHIDEGKVSSVIVYKLDRLGRKQKDVLFLLEDVFEKENVTFKSATEPFDTSTPLGKAMIGVLAVFAQLERDMIVERTTSGRRQRVSEGKWYGGPVPFGYKWDKEQQQLIIEPNEAHLIKEIFSRYLQGQSRLSIAEWAAERSKARTFDHNVVKDILSRPIYMGKLINGGVLEDGDHEPIIDSETWYAVQREMDKRSEGHTPVGEYLLTGLLRCGVCGSSVVHVKYRNKKRGKEYSYDYYACVNQHVRSKDKTAKCTLGYSRRADIEEQIIKSIKNVAANPKKFANIISSKSKDSDYQELEESLKTQLEKVTNSLENLYDAIESGEIKASAVSGRIRRLEEEREAISNQIEDIIDNKPKMKQTGTVISLIREIGNTWDHLNDDERKIVIRKIIKNAVIREDKTLDITWNLVE